MKYTLVEGKHTESGIIYTWLLPKEKRDELLICKNKANYNNLGVLALVENFDSVAVVKLLSVEKVKIKDIKGSIPHRKVLNIWVGDPASFIVGYKEGIID